MRFASAIVIAVVAMVATSSVTVRSWMAGNESAAIDAARTLGVSHLAAVALTELAEGYDLDPASGRRAYRLRYAASLKWVAVTSATIVWSASALGDVDTDGESAARQVAAEVVEAIAQALPRS